MQTGNPSSYVRWFKDLRNSDVALVGGKNASLGEMYATLTPKGVRIPNGFALTAEAYRDALTEAGAWPKLHALLDALDKSDVDRAGARRRRRARDRLRCDRRRGAALRSLPRPTMSWRTNAGPHVPVAVRSTPPPRICRPRASPASTTPTSTSAATSAVFEACRRCFASLFTDRAISYRDRQRLRPLQGLPVGRRDEDGPLRPAPPAGVIFTIDTESGFRDVVFITGSYGLGENIVQGQVDPDEFYVHKPTYRRAIRAVLRRTLGGKAAAHDLRARPSATPATHERADTAQAEREQFCLTDEEVLAPRRLRACAIEDHYSQAAGQPMPMDIEWAKDGADGELYIVQARPETVASQRSADVDRDVTR